MTLFRVSGIACLSLVLASALQAAPQIRDREQHMIEEQILLRTIEEQGGRSHASGDRAALGRLWVRTVAPRADRTIRVGLTPTLFSSNGEVSQEYWTAAAHNHDVVEITSTVGIDVWDLTTGVRVFTGFAEPVTFRKNVEFNDVDVTGPGGTIGHFAGPFYVFPRGGLLIVNSIRRINRLTGGTLTAAPYRGYLEVFQSTADSAKLRLVNVVQLDPDYVAGVVPNESLASFHVEALKAQAIAARGYAIANVGRFASRGFDVDDSTSSQVYRGQSSEVGIALAAARETEGLVMTREGQIISALYSSSMGGHTESNEYVFPAPSTVYPGRNADAALRAVHDAGDRLLEDLSTELGVLNFYSTTYSASSEVHPATGNPLTSLHRWTRTRSTAQLLARLKESFNVPASANTIQDIRTILRGDSGRMMQVVIEGDWGSTTISGWSDLRRLATLAGIAAGGTAANSAPNSPSTYVITRDGDGAVQSVLFYGGGFGHNVGMSQYGSHGRALRGQTAHEILSGYYSNSDLTTIPLALSADAFEQSFFTPTGRAVLVIDNFGLTELFFRINQHWEVVTTPPFERIELDLAGLLAPGQNRILYVPRFDAGAGAIVRLRMLGSRQ